MPGGDAGVSSHRGNRSVRLSPLSHILFAGQCGTSARAAVETFSYMHVYFENFPKMHVTSVGMTVQCLLSGDEIAVNQRRAFFSIFHSFFFFFFGSTPGNKHENNKRTSARRRPLLVKVTCKKCDTEFLFDRSFDFMVMTNGSGPISNGVSLH